MKVMHAGKTQDVFQTSGRKSPEARWRHWTGQFREYSVETTELLVFLLLLALGVRLCFARIEVCVVVAVVVVLVLVRFLLLAVALVLQRLPGEEEDGPGDDSLADVVPDLKVGCEERLGR